MSVLGFDTGINEIDDAKASDLMYSPWTPWGQGIYAYNHLRDYLPHADDVPGIPEIPELPSFDWSATPFSDWMQGQDKSLYGVSPITLSPAYYGLRNQALGYTKSGPIAQALNGDYNWQQFTQGYTNPALRNLRQYTLPSIAASYSGLGGNYNSGARMAAQANAASQVGEQINTARLQEYDAIPTRAINAYGTVMPTLANIVDVERQVATQNKANELAGIDNELQAWSNEQELGFNVASAQANLGITAANLQSQYDMAEWQIEAQKAQQEAAQQASLYGLLGGGGGAGLGFLLGNLIAPGVGGIPGMMIGSTLGAGAGTYLGGGNVSPALMPSVVNNLGSQIMYRDLLQGAGQAGQAGQSPVYSSYNTPSGVYNTNPSYPYNVSTLNGSVPTVAQAAYTSPIVPSVVATSPYPPSTYIPNTYISTQATPRNWTMQSWAD